MYSQKAYGGTSENTFDLEWFIPRKKKKYQALLDSLVTNSKGIERHEPINRYYTALKTKLKQYSTIQKSGGLPKLENLAGELRVGDSPPDVPTLKKYFFLVKDLANNDTSAFVDQNLLTALKSFQHRMGLVENGKLDKATLSKLNKPVNDRIRQIMVNLERLRWMPVEVESDYLLVNIPEF